MKKSLHLAASAAVLALGVSSVRGATISSTSTYVSAASVGGNVGYGQTLGTAGYWFPTPNGGGAADTYDVAGQDFVTSFTDHPVNGSANYAGNYAGPITLYSGPSSSASFTTGGEYSSAGSGVTFASFTLTGTVPAEFQLTLLMDNGGTNSAKSQFVVTDAGPSGSASDGSGTITSTVTSGGVLDFYSIDISGASAGDIIAVTSGAYGSSYDVLGGVLLDAVSAPEPSTLSLLGVGTVALLARRRKAPGASKRDRITVYFREL